MANERLKTVSMGSGFLRVIVIFCLFALGAWALFWLVSPSETYEDKRAQGRRDKVAAITKEAQDKLYSPMKWIDKNKGTIQLPIDTAMDIVVAAYQQKPVRASVVKVDNPYPVGLQPLPAPPATTGSAAPAVTGSAAPVVTGSAAPAAKPAQAPASSVATPPIPGTGKPEAKP